MMSVSTVVLLRRCVGPGAEVIVENMPPDGDAWVLADHLCAGEAAVLCCDGRWKFRVTAPPAAAGCEFVCERREPVPPLPPLAPAAPRTSPLDMLLEASRLQPQYASQCSRDPRLFSFPRFLAAAVWFRIGPPGHHQAVRLRHCRANRHTLGLCLLATAPYTRRLVREVHDLCCATRSCDQARVGYRRRTGLSPATGPGCRCSRAPPSPRRSNPEHTPGSPRAAPECGRSGRR